MHAMSEDAKAILLLCGHLGGEGEFSPLTQTEYNQVVQWLLAKNLRPADLLVAEAASALACDTSLPEARLRALLKRGVKLGFAVEQWNQSGIWVICRSDPAYPMRYKKHLLEKAPAILFGAGEQKLLQGGGLAIVGSRDVDAEGEAFASDVAAWCARGGMPVVSGGARGVDRIAMTGALEAGGVVIGVLADSLLRQSVSRDARDSLSDGRLVLISPYHPEAGFNVGYAMGRNKLIYALADYGLVVSSDYKKGGTWEGATEELKRPAGRPVFVRMNGNVPVGNRKLVELGGAPFPEIGGYDTPATRLADAAAVKTTPPEEAYLPLFAKVAGAHEREPSMVKESPLPVAAPPCLTGVPPSIYKAVLPVIEGTLEKPATAADLATRLSVSKVQLETWLKQAVSEKKLRKLTKPVRYARQPSG